MHRKTVRLVRSARYLSRSLKQLVMLAADLVAIPAALWSAYTLRFGSFQHDGPEVYWLYATALVTTVPVFVKVGLYRAVIRFLGIQALVAISIGVGISAALLGLVNSFVLKGTTPVEVFAIYFLLALVYVGFSRFGARELLRLSAARKEPVIIYGAGFAGAQLCSALGAGGQFRPVALVDDNPKLRDARVSGFKVSSPDRLVELRARFGANLVLLALPSVTRRRRSQIIEAASTLGFKVLTVPDVAEIVSGQARLEEIRDIDVHDLLGRDPVPPNAGAARCLRARQVHPGDRRRWFDRLGAVSTDHGPVAAATGAARSFGARALRDRTRTAFAECSRPAIASNSWRCWATRTTSTACARSSPLSACRPCTTPPRTNTCPSSNTT